jgi:hypothetical protein
VHLNTEGIPNNAQRSTPKVFASRRFNAQRSTSNAEHRRGACAKHLFLVSVVDTRRRFIAMAWRATTATTSAVIQHLVSSIQHRHGLEATAQRCALAEVRISTS